MNLLGIDIGSSSVKAAILRNGRIKGTIARSPFPTRFDGPRVEVDPQVLTAAVANAIHQLDAARQVDAIGLTVMAPSWLAIDATGRALTPIVTHQDRRSVEEAREIERRLGKDRHLRLAANRPFPGGISSTTWLWYHKHAPGTLRRADLIGHLNTYLHRRMTGARVTDPSNASFMGLYSTLNLSGWNDELCSALGVPRRVLPEVLEADRIAGSITPDAARQFGLKHGTPMIVGMMDGSAAMLLTGAAVGQLVNSSGSTDVLGLCTDRPAPHDNVLTRALGIGRRWMSVCTLAAAGSALNWAQSQLFPDLPERRFRALMHRLADHPFPSTVRFEPYLAGDRTSLTQRQAAFTGLTLASTREHLLGAMIEALAQASASRIPLLRHGRIRMRRTVIVTGGVQGTLHHLLHRDWPGQWRFRAEKEATLRGLGVVQPRNK